MASIDIATFKKLAMCKHVTNKNDLDQLEDDEDIIQITFHPVPEKDQDPRGAWCVMWWSIEDGDTIYKTTYNTSSQIAYEMSNFRFDEDSDDEEENEELPALTKSEIIDIVRAAVKSKDTVKMQAAEDLYIQWTKTNSA